MKNNFHYVGVLLDMLYGIEIEDEELEEIGLLGWNLIGNKDVKLYRYCAEIDPQDNSVTLPCNIISNGTEGGIIEAVTASFEDWNRTTNKSINGNWNSSYIEETNEYYKYFDSPYYMSGKLLKYELIGDKLYFTHNYGKINILYKGILMDEDGLPEITDKEATAIATYIAYIKKFKDSIVTGNQLSASLAALLKNLWLQQCDQARVTYLNLNDMNNIIEVAHNWDRPVYSKSIKVIR